MTSRARLLFAWLTETICSVGKLCDLLFHRGKGGEGELNFIFASEMDSISPIWTKNGTNKRLDHKNKLLRRLVYGPYMKSSFLKICKPMLQ